MEFYYHGVDENVLILSADGGLDAMNAREFVAILERVIQAGPRKLLVDCTQLTYISSYGIGLLGQLHSTLARQGGHVKLAAVRGKVAKLLELSGLNQTFEIYTSVDDALVAFREVDFE